MPNVADCLLMGASQNLIDRDRAQELAAELRQRAEELAADGTLSLSEADRAIAMKLDLEVDRKRLRKRRTTLLQAAIQQDILANIAQAREDGFGVDQALYSRLSNDPRERIRGVPDLDTRIKTVRGQIQKEYADYLEEFRPRLAGLNRDSIALLHEFTREVFNENTGNVAAKTMADGVRRAQDYSRTRFNAAGGDVAERADYHFPMRHDQARVAAVSRDEWVDYTFSLVNRKTMLNAEGSPMSDAQLRRQLEESYDSIATGGLTDIGARGAGTSVESRAQSRFINYKDSASWMAYHQRFGNGTLVSHVNGLFDRLARDIATLEILGPQPEATVRFMEDQLDQALLDNTLSRTGAAAARSSVALGSPKVFLRSLYNTVTGRTAQAADSIVASISQANRNILVSATLGSAWLSAIADLPLAAMTARINGMSAVNTLRRHLGTFVTNSRRDRALALRLGFTAQGWADKSIAAQRIVGESVGPEWTEKLTNTVLRATWLSPWTEAGRYGFQTEMLSHITGLKATGFNNLDSATRATFDRYGITESDWQIMRDTPNWRDPESGAEFLRAEDIADGEFGTQRFEAANKLQQAIFAETDFAVVTSNPRVRALLTGGSPAGTFWGEVMRNAALFKGFPVSIMHQHFSRLMAQKGITRKAEYAAWMFLGLSTMGMLGEQMNNLASGRDLAIMDPSSEEGRNAWYRAIMRGGAFGLLGDLVFGDVNRWGGGLWQGLLGPVARQTEDAVKLTVGNVQQLARGDTTNAGRELSRFVQSMTPGRSAWYAKLALERLIFDQLDYALDPNASEAFRRVEQRAERELGQQFFWRPGQATPDRAPEVAR